MTTAIFEKKPLCWLKDKEGNTLYKETSYEELKRARRTLCDIECSDLKWKKFTLTHYEVQKYGEADIVDHFLYFVLPKEDKIIRDRFLTVLSNMTNRQRDDLTYEFIERWIAKQKSQEAYYENLRGVKTIDSRRLQEMRAEVKFKLHFSGFKKSILNILSP